MGLKPEALFRSRVREAVRREKGLWVPNTPENNVGVPDCTILFTDCRECWLELKVVGPQTNPWTKLSPKQNHYQWKLETQGAVVGVYAKVGEAFELWASAERVMRWAKFPAIKMVVDQLASACMTKNERHPNEVPQGEKQQ